MTVVDPKTGDEVFLHPETGEVLATEQEWREALSWVEGKIGALYRVRWNMQDAHARAYPEPAPLPARRNRTETQERIARCPRCGEHLKK